MISTILSTVRNHWEELGTNNAAPREFRYALQSRHRVILFLFDAHRGETPVAIVKISRDCAGNAGLERSVRHLRDLRQQIADADLLATIPRAVLLDPVRGLSAALETCAVGEPMTLRPVLRSAWSHHRRNFAAWRAWLSTFQHATYVEHAPLALEQADGQNYGREALPAVLKGISLPMSWRFGDAHYSNILLQGGRVSGVVDWEGSKPRQWVLDDWLNFVFQYLVELRGVLSPQTTRNTLAQDALASLVRRPTSRLDEVAQEETSAFLAGWELRRDLLPAYVAAFAARLHWREGKDALLSQLQEAIKRARH